MRFFIVRTSKRKYLHKEKIKTWKQYISLFKLQETVITVINNWTHQFVKHKSKHKRDGVEAVEEIIKSARPPTVSDLKQALK